MKLTRRGRLETGEWREESSSGGKDAAQAGAWISMATPLFFFFGNDKGMQLAAGTKLFPFLFFYTEELGANAAKIFLW